MPFPEGYTREKSRLRAGLHIARNLYLHHVDEPPTSKSGLYVGVTDWPELTSEIVHCVNAARDGDRYVSLPQHVVGDVIASLAVAPDRDNPLMQVSRRNLAAAYAAAVARPTPGGGQ